ncbi:hypothetical protein OG407_07380 [Streptomyces sp. NBC_01515]|uniref:hypothetical protein n=1 Tax=Streptomyces sp. NBC_01515 TaxID=2903890 RepID=UPI00386D5754
MRGPLDTYVGWEKPEHRRGCKRPAWDVSVRVIEREYRRGHGFHGEPVVQHACADKEYCDHGPTYDATVVRIVCLSCGAAQVVSGENTRDTGETITSTQHLGYGLPPRKARGLLLWPAEPWLNLGRAAEAEPHDFVVTRLGVKAVTKDVVVGQITKGTGERRGVVWTALAVAGTGARFEYGYGGPMRFQHANDGRGRGGSPLRTVVAAARWIGERLAEQPEAGAAA